MTVFISSFLISTIIFVLSGFKHEIRKNIFEFVGNYRFQRYDRQDIDISEFEQKFTGIKGMRKISPYATNSILIQCKDAAEGAIMWGMQAQNIASLKKYIVQGDVVWGGEEVVLGRKLFEKLRIKLGDKIVSLNLDESHSFAKYKVVGLFETGIDDIDEKVILCDISVLKPGLTCEGVNIFFEGNYEDLKNAAKGFWGRLKSVEEEYVYVMDWLKIIEKNALLYICIILLTTLTNIVCILMLQIFERKKMIDLLLWMGLRRRSIENIFVLKNVFWVLRKMLWGSIWAFLLCFLQKKFRLITLSAEDYYLNFVPINFDLLLWSVGLLTMFFFVWLSLKLTFLVFSKK